LVSDDVDTDNMSDEWEALCFGNLSRDGIGDYDIDGLTDLIEFQMGTNPISSDTDRDGMSDGWEVRYNLNPLKNDASGDPDNDECINLQEYYQGGNPGVPDIDCFPWELFYPIFSGKRLHIK